MAFPKGSKYVQGTCACGHVGRQLDPNICSNCKKHEVRKIWPSDEERWLASRVDTVRRRFLALPTESQRNLIREFASQHEVNWIETEDNPVL